MTVREDRFGNVVQASRPTSTQTLAVGAASVVSAAFAVNQDRPTRLDDGQVQTTTSSTNHTRHVRLVGTVSCWVSFGNPPNAAVRQGTSSMFLPAGLPEYFWVSVGEQIAVIQDATGGFLYITELTN